MLTQLDLDEASNRVRLGLAEREAAIARLHQEIRNLVNDSDLASRLIERLPELAEHMPQMHELKVLQTGGDAGFDSMAAFISRMLALGETLGISMRPRSNP